MEFMIEYLVYIQFVVGFALLIKGADFLVDGAAAIAKKLNISDIAIALTIVSFGTSAPELFVNLIASFQGSAELAVGNILGSNIANILLILGVASLINPLTVQKNTVWKEIPFSVLAALVVAFVANDRLLDGYDESILNRADGLVLISFFAVFLYYTYTIARQVNETPLTDEIPEHEMSTWKALVFIGLGMIGLPLGGDWIVQGATKMALEFGLSESLIGLSIVAIGTSLPEVAASSVAAYKGKSDIAIGNAVGSNIFNIFWVLGLSSIIKPIPFDPDRNIDISMTIVASFILFVVLQFGRKHEVERSNGILFLMIYAAYMGFIIFRG